MGFEEKAAADGLKDEEKAAADGLNDEEKARAGGLKDEEKAAAGDMEFELDITEDESIESEASFTEYEDIDFAVDEDRKEPAVEEYMLLYSDQLKRTEKMQWMVLVLVLLVFCASYAIIAFTFMMIRMSSAASVTGDMGLFDLVLGLIIPGTLGFIVLVMFLIMRSARRSSIRQMREDVMTDMYSIRSPFLYRTNVCNNARDRAFDLDQIHGAEYDGAITSFEFQDEIFDIPDYYDPPLHEVLDKLTR